MSGLAGVLFGGRPPDEGTVARMLAAAPHRGSCVETVALGGARLGIVHGEIVDASVASDGRIAAACAGSVMNRDELRGELRLDSARPGDLSDAALLVAAFHRHGSRLPAVLRGNYAVAITDGESLWFFRDHLGFRSLFYHENGEGLFIGSEAKQVAAGAGLPLRADREIVVRNFWGDYETDSAVRGVKRLDSATLATGSRRGVVLTRYWNPDALLESARPSFEEIQERFDALMTQAVRRCMADRSVISLSGGIDSPTIAGYAAPIHEELYGRPLPALSIVAPNHPSVDESELIELVVRKYGFPWHKFEQRVLTGGSLDRWATLCDGPVPTVTLNEMEEYYTAAHDLGFRNMLTGELAEFVADREKSVLVHLMLRGRTRALVRRIRVDRSNGRKWRDIAIELASAAAPRWYINRRRRNQLRPMWIDGRLAATGLVRYIPPPRRRWRTMQLAAVRGTNPTIEAAEVCENLCGIRVRRPWVDIDLWEFFLTLPAEVKHPGPLRKSLVRRLARGRVPDAILDRRRKTVFDASLRDRMNYEELDRWLKQPRVRIEGVDYRLLGERLARRELDLVEYRWARDLASTHAFLDLFGE